MEINRIYEASSTFFWWDTSSHITEKKIQSFKELERGWHYGEGVSIKQSVLDNAILLNQEAINQAFYETDAFPGLNGEVMVTIYSGEHYLEFTLEPNGNVTFYREKDNQEICYQEGLSFQDAKTKIMEFREELWRESESSIRDTMTGDHTDLQASLLRTLGGTIPAFPLLKQDAFVNLEERFVITFDYSMEQLQVLPQYSGASQQRFYQQVTG